MTGYVVHYSSNGVTNSLSGLSSSATSYEITGLTNGRIYTVSVEATSEQLSGESEPMIIVLCKFPVNINNFSEQSFVNIYYNNYIDYNVMFDVSLTPTRICVSHTYSTSSRGCECE